jgi:predicted Zn finger-like uncharacterized protein
MDVRCERCGTEYEFDDALVSDKGTTVKCMSCGHQFRVQRPSALKAPDKWLVRRPNGEELVFVSLRELQRAIAAHQVGKEDQLFRGALRARSLGSIPELQPFFERAGKPPQKSTSRGLGMPPPPAAPLPSMGLTQPFSLANQGNPTPTLRPPGALPPMNEPMPPVTPPSPMTPLPPPVAIAGPRASVPPVAAAPPPAMAMAMARSAPPPALPAPTVVKSAPPPAVAKSAPPPAAAAVKSAPPPAVVTKRPPPPTNREVAATEPLPPLTAPIPDDPPTAPITEPAAEPARRAARPASDPPARATSEPAPPRRRSVPAEPDADEEPRRRDPGILRWVVAGSILGLTALLAGTLGRQHIAQLSAASMGTGTAASAPSATATGSVPAVAPTSSSSVPAAASGSGKDARSPALAELVRSAEKSLKEGDLEAAKEALVRANAMAPKDAGVLVDLAKVATTKADVAWLRLRLLPKTATDARRLATTELNDAGKRAKAAAEAASASSPESPDTLEARVDALRLTDDLAGAQKLTAKLATEPVQPGAALALAALDLVGDEPPSAKTLERLRQASDADGGAGRARGFLVYALTRAGDPASATKELEKLAALPRPYPLLTELRTLVAATKQTATTPAGAGAGTEAVPIGKLPAVVPVPFTKPDNDFKINDTPAPPKADGDPPPTPATATKTPPPPPSKKEPKGEFTEEELHKKLFGDQPK